jgi:hypothetical protein
VRDGINLARRGIPTVCLLTEKFSSQGVFISRAAGMPDIPKVILPHPVAGSEAQKMQQIADAAVDLMITSLEGVRK